MGKETLGRIINVIGEPVDEQGPVSKSQPKPSLHVFIATTAHASPREDTADVGFLPHWQGAVLGLAPEKHCACADCKETMGIHREAPPFIDQSTEQEILVTGIKVG